MFDTCFNFSLHCALALWKDEKIKVSSTTNFFSCMCVSVWSMIFNNKDMESKDESYARWKELYLYIVEKIEKERNFCCCLEASCNKNYFRCMTQMFVHKRIRNRSLLKRKSLVFNPNVALKNITWHKDFNLYNWITNSS